MRRLTTPPTAPSALHTALWVFAAVLASFLCVVVMADHHLGLLIAGMLALVGAGVAVVATAARATAM